MQHSKETTEQEKQYLAETLDFLARRLAQERQEISKQKEDIITLHRDIYASQASTSDDISRMSEQAQMLSPLTVQTRNYQASEQRILLFERMLEAPYFARIDFSSPGWGDEVVYIGIGNLEDEDTFDVYVYDWRAPIASVFYRYELGEASYQAPAGTITGEVTLKRQYEILKGELQYFFDSGVNIVDEILKKTLSQNSSPKMRTIVETIQREQDLVIRDTENDLVIVQGVAGSGKTSIALHRAAYLMYEGLSSKLTAKNMILISPNRLFEQYIAQVLPELGEENIRTLTFEEIFYDIFQLTGEEDAIESRNAALEEIFTQQQQEDSDSLHRHYIYKTTDRFLGLLDWFTEFYLYEILEFPDFIFGDKVIAQSSSMKQRLLASLNDGHTPQASLQQIKIHIANLLEQGRKERLKELEKLYGDREEHVFDYKDAAREHLMVELRTLQEEVNEYVILDYPFLYHTLMSHPLVLKQAAKEFPEFPAYAEKTREQLADGKLSYVDAMALLYLKVKMDTIKPYQEIRQVVVDEAQDYSTIHFEILARLFPNAKYTVLADTNQTLLDTETDSLYDTIESTLQKPKNVRIQLNKSFRCSYEISTFSAHFADIPGAVETLERHEAPPLVVGETRENILLKSLADTLAMWQGEGFKTLAIVTKTMKEARELHEKLSKLLPVELLEEHGRVNLSCPIVLPVYLAKGLEFDAVAVYGVDEESYHTKDHRRLLYIACTRALHRLGVYYLDNPSPLLPEEYL